MDHGLIVAMGTADEIIEKHGSGERLEIHGSQQLAAYLKENTKLNVEYTNKGLISIKLNDKTDALTALTAADKSGLEWNEIHTRRDSLDDVFVKLVSGMIDEQGDVKTGNNQRGVNKLG